MTQKYMERLFVLPVKSYEAMRARMCDDYDEACVQQSFRGEAMLYSGRSASKSPTPGVQFDIVRYGCLM